MLTNFKDKNVLLLQGPLGPFFKRFSKDLKKAGANTFKINFCGGDNLFYRGKDVTKFKDTLYNWPPFVTKFINDNNIDAIFLLGDMRPYHRRAIEMSKSTNCKVYVFEEGYLRPDFITLEADGVNGNSKMSKEPDFYKKAGLLPKKDLKKVGKPFGRSAWFTAMYYTAMTVAAWFYPNYVHHRDSSLLYHIGSWLRSAYRKIKYKFTEAKFLDELQSKWADKYFLFPLQVHNDYQFKHSKYQTIEDCIEEVFASFSEHAPKDNMLVVKHHPADRPYKDYKELIKRLSIKYLVQDRILYIHDVHLPTLLKNAKGTILMNSTVGLASIHYKTPVMVLGNAIYQIPGLISPTTINKFWNNQVAIDYQLYLNFRGWLEHNNQINGNYYMQLKNSPYFSGVDWDDFTFYF